MSRVLHIGDAVQRLRVKHRQVIADRRDDSPSRTAPLADVDAIVLAGLEHLGIDRHALQQACEMGTAVVVCDDRQLPSGVLLPLFGAWNHTEVLHHQIDMTLPRRKRAWQQVIEQKLVAQAGTLAPGSPTEPVIRELAGRVRSGDSQNLEAQGARLYWPALFGPGFRRIPRTREGLNGALDYGYAIARSVVARCATAVGLHPALGIHHRSRTNPLCLVDDLVEPLRPAVDAIVAANRSSFDGALEPADKRILVGLMETTFTCGPHRGLLTTAVQRYAESFRDYVLGESDRIEFPVAIDR